MKPSIRLLLLVVVSLALVCTALLFLLDKGPSGHERQDSARTIEERSTRSQPAPAIAMATNQPAREIGQANSGQGRDTAVVEPLAAAIGKGTAQDFESRLEAISRLGLSLRQEEISKLYDYLRDTTEEGNLLPGQTYALKNDIMNVLRLQKTPPEDLTKVLCDLRQDEAQPLVIRDYALQHLAPWYSSVDEEQRSQIVDELSGAAGDAKQSYAGTALLGLERVRQENADAKLPPIGGMVLALIADASANLLARITAVQLSGTLRIPEAAEVVANLAFDPNAPPTLRIAATRALGGFQGKELRVRLQQASLGEDPRLRVAAVSALRTMAESQTER